MPNYNYHTKRVFPEQLRHSNFKMTSSNGSIFRVTDPCAGNSPATAEFPSQRPVTRSFDVYFYLRLNKRLRKQSWDWWFEAPSRYLWRHCYVTWFTYKTCQISKDLVVFRSFCFMYHSNENLDTVSAFGFQWTSCLIDNICCCCFCFRAPFY